MDVFTLPAHRRRLLGRPPGDEETLIRTMALSATKYFHLMRRIALRQTQRDDINADRAACFKRVIGDRPPAFLRLDGRTRKD